MSQLLEDHTLQTAEATDAINERQNSLVAKVANNRLASDYLLVFLSWVCALK